MEDIFLASMAFFVPVFFLFGSLLGSFASVLIHRLHFDEGGIVWGRSHCPACKTVLSWRQLLPVLSWLLQGGKCHACKTPVSVLYPIMELTFGAVLALGAWMWGADIVLLGMGTLLLFLLLVLFFYDLIYLEVDLRIVAPTLIVAGAFGLLTGHSVYSLAVGMVLSGGFYSLQYFLSGWLGRVRWVGFGDVYLGMIMGLCLGWPHILLALLIAYFGGTAIALFLIAFCHYGARSKLPMGAFLMPAAILMLLHGDAIWHAYVTFLGITWSAPVWNI